jgi:hypothetical protein
MIYLNKSVFFLVYDLNRIWGMLGRFYLLGRSMHSGQLVFAQVMTYLSVKVFSRMVKAKIYSKTRGRIVRTFE